MTPMHRLRVEKAAADCGFELTPCRRPDGALELRSATFPETLWVAFLQETPPRFEVKASAESCLDDSTTNTIEVQGYEALYGVLQRASAVARTLPNRVADKYRLATAALPRSTEVERLVVQRVGQGLFREALLDHWQGRCGVTGLAVPGLLRASHIKPWAKCETDDERLNVFNGLLLAPHLDALFDDGWISFEDDGALRVSASLSVEARLQIGFSSEWRLNGLKPAHARYLAFHRQHEFRHG